MTTLFGQWLESYNVGKSFKAAAKSYYAGVNVTHVAEFLTERLRRAQGLNENTRAERAWDIAKLCIDAEEAGKMTLTATAKKLSGIALYFLQTDDDRDTGKSIARKSEIRDALHDWATTASRRLHTLPEKEELEAVAPLHSLFSHCPANNDASNEGQTYIAFRYHTLNDIPRQPHGRIRSPFKKMSPP